MKSKHEKWVSESLRSSRTTEKPQLLKRISSGKYLLEIISSAHVFRTDYEEQMVPTENEFIGSVLRDTTDYGDLLAMDFIESGERAKISSKLKEILNELERRGYALFAANNNETITIQDYEIDDGIIATLYVKSISDDRSSDQ